MFLFFHLVNNLFYISSISHHCLIFWHHRVDEIPERSLMMLLSQMGELMDDDRIDESRVALNILRQSIAKTKPILRTTRSPSSL